MPAGSPGNDEWCPALRGFTLLELVVVLALAALLLILVPPAFSKALAHAELKATAREIAATLRTARDRAVATQTDRAVTFDLSRRVYGPDRGGQFRRLPDAVGITVFAADSERRSPASLAIRYFPDGSATGGRITLSRQAHTYYVDVGWLTGRVKILE
ncbi:MAG: GspH/FimT family protein [Chromatiales bacterium]